MSLKVAVVGIDGSGKSTLARTLPMALSAEMNVVAGAAGDEFWVFGPDQDHLAPGFHPRGLPIAATLSQKCRRLAKRFANDPRLYPYLKLAHLMFQDDAAVSIGRRYGCDVVVSDGNLVLSAMGRAGNYKRGATHHGVARERSTVDDLRSVFSFLIDGRPLAPESEERLPSLSAAGCIARLARLLGFDGVWIPDVVLFLDVDPEVALERIKGRHSELDRHENLTDMTRARDTYLKALTALDVYAGRACTHVIEAGDAEPREMLELALDAVRPHVEAHQNHATSEVLGTAGADPARKLLNPRYLVRYLLGKFFQGAWREPLFLLSPMGRRLLREGYSAGVMRVIYDHDSANAGPIDRAFLGYPLHRAVADRLGILTHAIEPELIDRLETQSRVRLFTAPSGFCYDLFRPLESIAVRRPELMAKVELVAADLDPHGVLAEELSSRARKLGIDFRFIVGDITSPSIRCEFSRSGPYDLALFVGLSSWLPRAQAIGHLRWLAANLRPDGLLVSDCFMAAAYSLGGRYIGYRAHYYSPELYARLLDYCGFDAGSTTTRSGRDAINHMLVTRPAALQRVRS
jgi:adenylate kinase family enzyme